MAKKDDLKFMRKKIQVLKGEIAAAQDVNRSLKDKVQNLEAENFNLNRKLDEGTRLLKKILREAAEPEPSGKKIGRWNIVKSGGYYRAFRRIDGELRAIYLGKSLRGAAQKIKAKEATY